MESKSLFIHCIEEEKFKIMKLWDMKKNKGINPFSIPFDSNKKAWWTGECGHSWEKSIQKLAIENNTKCPYCTNRELLIGFNDLETVNPILAKEWHTEKNGNLNPKEVLVSSGMKVWWKCSKCGKERRVAINTRVKGNKMCKCK